MVVLDELPEESCGAKDHPSSLRLLCLGPGHSQGIVHVTLLVQNGLGTGEGGLRTNTKGQ